SPGYVLESDPEEEPEEDDEDLEEDPANYPADGDDDDNEDEDEDEEERRRSTQLQPTLSHLYTDRPTIARDDPYSIAREDLYGFVDMVDVPPRCSTSKELDYYITDTWDDLVGAIDEISLTTVEGVNQRVTDLATIVEEETTTCMWRRVLDFRVTSADHKETEGDFRVIDIRPQETGLVD
ncbi:hypothetical protein Tco_0832250, partial [Tanacetum coccineum]